MGYYKEGKRHGTGSIIAQVRKIYHELVKVGNMPYKYTGSWVDGSMEGNGNVILLWNSEKNEFLLPSGVIYTRLNEIDL